VKVAVAVGVFDAVGVKDNAAMACCAWAVRAMEVKVALTCFVGEGVEVGGGVEVRVDVCVGADVCVGETVRVEVEVGRTV